MRALLATCLLACSALISAAPASAAATSDSLTVKGIVLEVRDAQGYTYLRLKTKDGDTWAAVNRARVNPGAEVTIEKAMLMHDFESKAMQRTFKKIIFGNLASNNAAGMDIKTAHKGVASAPQNQVVQVAKASGANARTVAEIHAKGGALKDKPVLLRAKVVKYNAGIMGKNWLHLRDGTGSDADSSNDILVTTSQTAKVSDVVTVKGIVRTDKDFGAGYVYKVLIEDATLQP
jgi:hypothetical protein